LPKPASKTSAPASRALRQLLVGAPQLGSPAEAGERVDRWLQHIGRTGAGKSLSRLCF